MGGDCNGMTWRQHLLFAKCGGLRRGLADRGAHGWAATRRRQRFRPTRRFLVRPLGQEDICGSDSFDRRNPDRRLGRAHRCTTALRGAAVSSFGREMRVQLVGEVRREVRGQIRLKLKVFIVENDGLR